MTIATLRIRSNKWIDLLEQAALKNREGDRPWYHSDIVIRFYDDRLEMLKKAPGGVVSTYNTVEPAYFEHYEVEEDGGTAIMNVERSLEYFDVGGTDGVVELTFRREADEGPAEWLDAEGTLSMSVRLPADADTAEAVPETDRWSDEDHFLSPSGNEFPTFVTTTVGHVSTILDAVDLDSGRDYYPISVQDGDFTLDVEADDGSVSGFLQAKEVDGKDLTNWYSPGFRAVFVTLTGEVELQTAPGDAIPMAVVARKGNRTFRHVLTGVAP